MESDADAVSCFGRLRTFRLFLLVVDSLNQKLQVISINRNTMTDIKLCDKEGYSMGTIQGQICLQHAFGDAKRISCQRSVDAVADLFGNIPISGYLAMNMGAIPTIDAVEVVRCKDCTVPHNKYTGCAKLIGLVTPPDFFCPFGEQKKGE